VIEFYAQIKRVHVASVIASGHLFLMRGLLLSAAFMLQTIIPRGLYSNGWLTLKLVLLVVYVVLGSLALKRGRCERTKTVTFAAAAVTYVGIIGIAHLHHPLDWLCYLVG